MKAWIIATTLCLCAISSAAEKAHGVSIFGPKSLKYKEGEPFAYLNPNAPIAGRLKLPTNPFTKLTYFGLTGNQPRMLEHCFDTLGVKSWDDDEPYACYGLIAKYFEVADDRKVHDRLPSQERHVLRR
jgi:ABC-type oligopeptide transport system substrate-binding subunit